MSKRPSEIPTHQCEGFAKRTRENSVVSSRQKAVSINDRLPVELLEKLTQFISRERHRNFNPPQGAVLANIGAIVIIRRFDLRYLCLRWHNIVHRSQLLHFRSGSFELRSGAVTLSKRRENVELLKSNLRGKNELERQGVWFNLIDCINLLDVASYHYHADDPSILRRLTNATSGITQPCDLHLNFVAYDVDGARSMVKDPDADFTKLFPNLTLRHLNLDFSFDRDENENFAEEFESVARVTKYSLDIGKMSLDFLSIQFMALDSMSEDWVCESLQTLDLTLDPLNDAAEWSEEKVAAEFAKQRRIPRMFPRLESIMLTTRRWRLVDLTILREMERLRNLEVWFWADAQADLKSDWTICALHNIECLKINWPECAFPMRLCEFVPNVKQLKLNVAYKNACVTLLSELNGNFQNLSVIDLDFYSTDEDEVPPMDDVVALFIGLRQLPALASLNFELPHGENADWCRPGDFSLLQALPGALQGASFSYCFLPAPMVVGADTVVFIFHPNVPDAEEAIFKTWFQTIIHRLCELPNLERFFCRICAPSFHAAVSLAAKWGKSSVAAIADLGLASVVNVSCSTDAYLSVQPDHAYRVGDKLKFRFTLSPTPGLSNRKFPTRMFTFELEYPDYSNYQLF